MSVLIALYRISPTVPLGIAEGESLGMFVGNALGEADGVPLGWRLGIAEGESLGKYVGEPLGLADGFLLGCRLGTAEGESLGGYDGEEVGLADGVPVGCWLGTVEGDSLGKYDGEALRETDGLLDSISSRCSTALSSAPPLVSTVPAVLALVGDSVSITGLPVGGEGEGAGVSGADDVITAVCPSGVKVSVTKAFSSFKKSSSRSA
jgi:outer membrane lipoprotein SlyB